MVITYVMDLLGLTTNGTSVTAMRSAEVLRRMGNEVRFVCLVPKNADVDLSAYRIFPCHVINFGPFNPLIEGNGMYLARLTKEDYPKLREFLQGSDVVHLFMPFHLENQVRPLAVSMGIAVSSAMHVQPENVSYNIGMGHLSFVNALIYSLFKRWTYHYVRNVHTPSEMMKEQMLKHHYRNDIFPISNGVDPSFHPMPVTRPKELQGRFVITMVGRLSPEKRQDLILKAVGHSKYNDRIQVVFCGLGPRKKKLEKMSRKYLRNPAIFKFVNQAELKVVLNSTDLYIHASDAESEAISCIEAFSCGNVPVISDSKVSATNHFALDPRCLFKAGDYRSLKERIEYFYEHPEVIRELSPKYVEYGKTFQLEACVQKLLGMFQKTVEENEEEKKNGGCFHTSVRERHRIRKAARLAGIKDPYIPRKKK
jgi:glycosyltransferase involved in cell wall biosynthesis